MMKTDEESEVQKAASPRTTIVGGRPPEKASQQQPVPVGIQQLLRLASVDASFRRELIERRQGAAEAAGIVLTKNEAAILAAIPDTHLGLMAEKLPPPAPPRRDFLRQTAATAVVLLGGAALANIPSACSPAGTEPVLPTGGTASAQVADAGGASTATATQLADAGANAVDAAPVATERIIPNAGVRPIEPPPSLDAGRIPIDPNPGLPNAGASAEIPPARRPKNQLRAGVSPMSPDKNE